MSLNYPIFFSRSSLVITIFVNIMITSLDCWIIHKKCIQNGKYSDIYVFTTELEQMSLVSQW